MRELYLSDGMGLSPTIFNDMAIEFLELIKINEFPTQTNVVPGESWFVITGPDGVGRKISEERLRYFLTTSTAGYVGNATPSTVPNTALGPQFYTATEIGTYTNFGGLTVAANELALLSYNGTSWSKSVINVEVDITAVSGTTEYPEINLT